MAKLENIIEALYLHEDPSAVAVLEEVGTNCEAEKVRKLTARALVKRNTYDSLKLVISSRGKGVNDLNSEVAMATIDEIIGITDKTQIMNVINDTINSNPDNDIRENAMSIRTLIEMSA